MSDEGNGRACPVFIVKKGTMSARDIRRVEKMAKICVVESTEPEAASILEPPSDADVSAQARAALALFRRIKESPQGQYGTSFSKLTLMEWFTTALMDSPIVPRVQKIKTK